MALKKFKWPLESAEGGQTWPSNFWPGDNTENAQSKDQTII